MATSDSPSAALRDSLLATLRFAHGSGAWIVPGPPSTPDSPVSPEKGGSEVFPLDRLARVRQELGECTRCRLSKTRTQLVFGTGSPRARLLFVGEAPGAEEDRRGEPFVGRAGQLLDRMIGAIGLQRRDVYIANVLKCRPPNNRDPGADEVETCSPFLWNQVDAIRPAVICALGAHAARTLLGVEGSLASMRGGPRRVRGWQVVATYHPAYLLRNPIAKRQAWQDLQLVLDLLESSD